MNKTLYVHIPFCQEICIYCDFPKQYQKNQNIHLYLENLIKELKQKNQNYSFSHVYFGGGTPSILTSEELDFLLKNIFDNIKLLDNPEVTFECNPESIDQVKIDVLKKYNVNRISMGVQSFNDVVLKLSKRSYNQVLALEKIKLLEQNFKNYNLDFIFGLPLQTKEDIAKDLKIINKIKPPHLSYYSLIIEDNTILTSKKLYNLTSEDEKAEMFEIILKELNDYRHYEISNFSLDEKNTSLFNLNYWIMGEYLGIGLGAHSFIENHRINNTKSLRAYNQGKYILESRKLDNKELFEDSVFLGLRTNFGTDIIALAVKYKINLEKIQLIINDLIGKKLLEKNTSNLYCLTKKGLFLGNEVFEAFIL